jgi:hypothetical protein
MSGLQRALRRLLFPVAFVSSVACEPAGTNLAPLAAAEVSALAPLASESLGAVRSGLPDASKRMTHMLDDDPGTDLAGLQRVLRSTTVAIPGLQTVWPTYAFFVDRQGTVLRTDSDPDSAAGRSLVASFPDLRAALVAGSGVVAAKGRMAELSMAKAGPDATWLAAHPMVNKAGEARGALVVGWSLRRLAHALEDLAHKRVEEAATKSGKKVPVVYVYILQGGEAFGALLTPEVGAAAVAQMDLLAKTASGPYRGAADIGERAFGVAAERLPALADDAVLVVVYSDV